MGFEQLAELKKQLAAKAKAERPAKPQTKPKAATPRRQDPVDPVILSIGRLQKHFPKAFPKNPAPKLPLKVGIHEELLAKAKEIGLETAAITEAVKTWCRGTRYWASIVEGAPRVDLEGNTAGEVTARDAAQARSLEARRKQPRKPKAAAAENASAQEPASQPPAPGDVTPPVE
ncbi:ProP effector [Methylobacillus rhizosphaerae]|uniref:ProP effector n=1 Tax=Methylobacillus rhizosphaerae TaxID=551994 RepID=A0A238ZDH6_9PROT|nr:ProQ/FinO family protein [Methylobacillus rhizosphaerae]SNR80744.1 ProP effector [Methylobacillus rhizosphaerae]